jgi:8-amino-7-oxononanoate synthase
MSLPPTLKKRLQDAIERRAQIGHAFTLPGPFESTTAIDLGSNDSLSLISSGVLREEIIREIERNPGFIAGAGGSRVLEPAAYTVQLEKFMAETHGAPDGLFFNSGYEANVAVFHTIPQSGDAIVHDSLIHASIHDGIKGSRASIVKPFAHNDPSSLSRVLEDLKETSPAIRDGRSTAFISIESVYSMDGDIAPVQRIVDETKRALPLRNYVLIVDEAHSNGLVGPNGGGYISHLGLEKEFAIRLQTCGKALGSAGGMYIF